MAQLDLDAIEARASLPVICNGCGGSSDEHRADQKEARSIGWETHSFSPVPFVERVEVRGLVARVRELEAENAGYRRSWASVNAAIEETGSYKP